jgi:glycosyltransferase involved in cell wall biosynthesis
MRIGIITSAQLPPREGIGHFVINLGRHLTAKGHTVVILTRGKGFNTNLIKYEGLDIYKLPYLPVFPVHVHFHGLFLHRFLNQMNLDLDVLDFQSPLVPALNTNIPSVATVHTLMIPAAQALETINVRSILIKLHCFTVSRAIEEALFAKNPIVCSVRPIETSELASYRVKPKSIVNVGVGVHDSFLEPLNGLSNSESPYIFYAGRLDYNKGLLNLIGCIKYVVKERPDVRFLLAGSGSLQPVLEKAAAADGVIDHVEFVGQLQDRARMRQLHRQAAVYMQPSYYEGTPASILEAMASATPIVYTDTPGARQLVTPEEGILTPPGQPQKLAEAVLEILSDEQRRQQMGRACREKVFANYTWEIVSQKILTCYEQAITEAGR